ncbi:MAG: hypothetical protein OHK93_004162 [Ramalina farinacea]|uniref:VPS9 domain-containing protein n=1 Tax=Ramalina farinacea TaxID=258253 RepID=A0AA43TRU7_9LECA|nr:hypothetical protein [Ramalina farinacea]
MASTISKRPAGLQASQSFTRLEPTSTSPLSRSRASTIPNRSLGSPNKVNDAFAKEKPTVHQDDIFEKSSLISGEEGSLKDVEEVDSTDVPEGFDELPVELLSLIDRFIESLGAKIYNTPPSIEKLSSMFQDFYIQAESHIATHISALSTRQSRGNSPSASISSRTSQKRQLTRSSSRDTLGSPAKTAPEQQMLTPQEVSDRRKARRLLDRKAVALEEAVERRVCERVYKRIWRHRSTLDEVRDEKLRSRTAALALVGIGLKELGVDINQSDISGETNFEDWIARAKDGLLRMNDAKYPLGKLQQLAAAHKCIVDLLTELHQSSSSADEILPTLIYTLITTPPEGINVISNLEFVQRFRSSNKVDGEAAYCLTNLEAAITFLETVDLASLRADEALMDPSPSKATSSRPTTPQTGNPTPMRSEHREFSVEDQAAAPAVIPISRDKTEAIDHPLQSDTPKIEDPDAQPTHRRRVSNIFQPPATALGAAGDAVRNTADQGIKSVGSALDNSFKLLFGRLGEQQVAAPNSDAINPVIVPKTLDDARKLMEPKPLEDDGPLSEVSSMADIPEEHTSGPKSDAKLISAIAGRKQTPRERSVDSSQGSKPAQQEAATASAVESMRNIGNSLNPLKGFGGMNVMRGFGRTSSSGTPTPTLAATSNVGKSAVDLQRPGSSGKASGTAEIKTLPPIQRFMDTSDASELKLSDVPNLLQDYKRLANALGTLGAF